VPDGTGLERYAAPEVSAGLDALGIDATNIPRFDATNAALAPLTGWRIVAVPGLIPDEQFFAHLAARSFPVIVWIRQPHRIAFDLERVMATGYRIDSFQRMYFVIDSFEQLFRAGYETDFGPLYDRIGKQPVMSPEVLLPGDRVVNPALC
jgi:phenylalanine-4-hydroxylase